MKITHLLMLFLLVLLWALPVSAQYTFYGAPEVVQLPPVQNSVAMQRTYPTTTPGPVLSPISPAYGAPSVPVKQPRLVQPEGSALQTEPGAQAGNRPSVVASMFDDPAGCCSLADETCGTEACGPICCAPQYCCPWFVSGGWITMGRDKANRRWTSYNALNEADQLTNTDDIYMAWGNGGEIRFGRRFCGCDCQTWALEGVYWGMKPIHGYLSTTHVNGVSTPLNVAYIDFGPLDPGTNYFDGAAEHRLWRRNEFHNVEVNILRGASSCCVPCWNVQWAVGVRFFKFDEDLRFGSLRSGYTWGQDGGSHEAYINDDIKNNLVGFQVGFDARSSCWRNLQLYLSPKLGIYNNYIENTYSIYRGDGVIPTPQGGGTYPVHATDNVFSVLTEIDMGLYWHVTQNWSAKIGYRLVAATNMGLADHQFIHYVNDVPELAHIKSNGDLLLHGAHVSVAFNY